MRDRITGETYGAGYCLHGEPTGDETPLDTYAPEYPADLTCGTCGGYTTRLDGTCPACEDAEWAARSAARWAEHDQANSCCPLTLVSAPRRAA